MYSSRLKRFEPVRLIWFTLGLSLVAAPKGPLAEAAESTQPATKSAEKYTLSGQPKAGDTFRVEADLQVGGQLLISRDGDVAKLPMSVVAQIRYEERWLDVPTGRHTACRSARFYEQAQAVIKIDKGGIKSTLRDNRRQMVVEAAGERTTMFSPQGPLRRDELDLIDVLGTSLVVPALLPIRPVALGQTWKPSGAILAQLLRLDAISHSDVECVLGKVTDQLATIAMAGSVHGAAEGVATEIELKAGYRFDRRRQRIVAVELAVKEKRSIGHVGPGLDVVAKLKMRIHPVSAAKHLKETAALKSMRDTPRIRLVHQSKRGGFRMTCDRRWYMTSDEPHLTVFRLIDRGELVAQCQISPLATQSSERPFTLTHFQNDIRFSLGKRFGQFVQAGQWQDEQGHQIFRVVAQGTVEELPIQWRYYLVVGDDGRRLALSFTVEEDLVDRLGDSDRKLVDSVELLMQQGDGKLETAMK